MNARDQPLDLWHAEYVFHHRVKCVQARVSSGNPMAHSLTIVLRLFTGACTQRRSFQKVWLASKAFPMQCTKLGWICLVVNQCKTFSDSRNTQKAAFNNRAAIRQLHPRNKEDWTHRTALYKIKPSIHVSQYCWLSLAATLQGLSPVHCQTGALPQSYEHTKLSPSESGHGLWSIYVHFVYCLGMVLPEFCLWLSSTWEPLTDDARDSIQDLLHVKHEL